jgi:hypothetical protein
MDGILSKKNALRLFCYFRQAERSVHYAQSSPNQWLLFVKYYDKGKQAGIAHAIRLLNGTGAKTEGVPLAQGMVRGDLVGILGCVARLLVNPLRTSWAFSVEELSFFSATLAQLLKTLHSSELPQKGDLTSLRMDCYKCHSIIGRKLVGIPEIRKARLIEHFLQSEFVNHVTFQDMNLDSR